MTINAALDGTYHVQLADGKQVEVMPILEMYCKHLSIAQTISGGFSGSRSRQTLEIQSLARSATTVIVWPMLKDYDEQTVAEMSGAPAELTLRLARDIWETTEAYHPVSIYTGEGINHYLHATLHNRASYLPLMLTGNIRQTWCGIAHLGVQLQGRFFQAAPWAGPGIGSFIHEDPFAPLLDENIRITHDHLRHTTDGEDQALRWLSATLGQQTFDDVGRGQSGRTSLGCARQGS